jgi:hypothetical protein
MRPDPEPAAVGDTANTLLAAMPLPAARARGGHVLRRYGIWLFTQPRPLHDSRIWEADDDWRPVLTKFQRVIGIRRTDPGSSHWLDFRGSFTEFGPIRVRRSLNELAREAFAPDYHLVQRATVVTGHRALLARAKGCAIVWAPRLRLASATDLGAHLVGTVLARVDEASEVI